ncbi:hypothetical protein [Aminobacter aminovorans]|uniref:Uncharacterized protein n=1 Tax=Aminobacter aminovorans TaxID=83263 RepID=A0ABR6H6L7_AMIAI|nr:hypothetical protein [Aminobacter aminovorans]MBB3706142.1 hypothetical protein [Aminobacter aminovorans]
MAAPSEAGFSCRAMSALGKGERPIGLKAILDKIDDLPEDQKSLASATDPTQLKRSSVKVAGGLALFVMSRRR